MSISDGVLANAANFNAAFESKNKTVVSKTANYTATSSDYQILCDASGGGFTITLPAAASNSGLILSIKRTDQTFANSVTIDGNASETVGNGLTQGLFTQYEELLIICNGTGWDIISRYIDSTFNTWTPTITTGTGTMTNYTATGYFQRIGEYARYRFKIAFTGAAGTWTAPRIGIQSGLLINNTKLVGGANGFNIIGYGSAEDSGVDNYLCNIQYGSTTYALVNACSASGTYLQNSGITSTVPFSFASGDTITGEFSVPISNWGG